MKEEVKLPENIIKLLLDLPESGMGYQLADIFLRDGRIIKEVTILNASIALLESTDKNIIHEITDIKLSKSNG